MIIYITITALYQKENHGYFRNRFTRTWGPTIDPYLMAIWLPATHETRGRDLLKSQALKDVTT